MTNITINPDRDVGMPERSQGRPRDDELQVLVRQFLALRPATKGRKADSFFVPGATRNDIEFLRRAVIRAGAGIRIHETEQDVIYVTHGVRCWRLAGEYDEL